jgi:hypothetical protein
MWRPRADADECAPDLAVSGGRRYRVSERHTCPTAQTLPIVVAMRLKLLVLAAVCTLLAAPAAAGAYTVGAEPSQAEKQFAERYAKESAEQQVRENAERREREAKAAEEKRAAEERPQREAEERKQREALQHREEAERAEKEAKEAAASKCVVPSLEGDSLASARRALRAAHCKLGRVTAPRGRHGTLVVNAQSPKHGTKHPAGTTVSVTLGPRRSRG